MLEMRNQSLHNRSETAERHFRNLKLWDRICLILLGLMLVVGIWNFLVVWQLGSGDVPDLADVGDLRTGVAGRAMWILAAAAMAAFIFKEWRWGERSLGMVYFIVGWLAITLIPVMADELIGESRQQQMILGVHRCEPGNIENGQTLRRDACQPAEITADDVRLTKANPDTRNEPLIQPVRIEGHRATWSETGRSDYTVYFLLRQDSMEACEQQLGSNRFASELPARGALRESSCVERDDAAWLVTPMESNVLSSPLADIYLSDEP